MSNDREVKRHGTVRMAPKNGMGCGGTRGRAWKPEELKAILRHEMTAPIEMDLGGMPKGLAKGLRQLAGGEGLLLKSYHDLLHHPSPPVELLEIAKDFAKVSKDSEESPLPRQVAAVIYYACIVTAWMRCGRKITTLNLTALLSGLKWALAQAWVDKETRQLLKEGRACILSRWND